MIYLDYNATTPLCDAAREAMLPYLNRHFGNPSSIHAAGRDARAAIDDARDKLAALLHAKPSEIIFTSGATESCNLAVLGFSRASIKLDGLKPSSLARPRHIISNKAEHHAVLNAVEYLEKCEGFDYRRYCALLTRTSGNRFQGFPSEKNSLERSTCVLMASTAFHRGPPPRAPSRFRWSHSHSDLPEQSPQFSPPGNRPFPS